jgi:hypothetical protein
MKTIEAMPGETLWSVAHKACTYALFSKQSVGFVFNNTECVAAPGNAPSDIIQRYVEVRGGSAEDVVKTIGYSL